MSNPIRTQKYPIIALYVAEVKSENILKEITGLNHFHMEEPGGLEGYALIATKGRYLTSYRLTEPLLTNRGVKS
mgnify:CR=1 FL=1